MSADGLVKSLIWKILANLVKHNGVRTLYMLFTTLGQGHTKEIQIIYFQFLAKKLAKISTLDQHVWTRRFLIGNIHSTRSIFLN